MIRKKLSSFVGHPVTQGTRRFTRRLVATCAVILAAAVVTTVTVDLGPALRGQAERQGTRFLQRPIHIGRLGVHLWGGQFQLDDLVIEGITPQSPPFLTVKRLRLGMPWSTLVSRRIVFDSIELDGWNMVVEMMPDGTHSFIKLPQRSGGRSAWTTTLQYVRARNGETTYKDHGTPWSVITRNLDISIARTDNRYVGRASFKGGTVAIQSYVPFDVDMASRFTIDDGRLLFDRIDLRHWRYDHEARRRRQPVPLAGADVPDAVHGGLSVDAEDLLRQRVVRAVGNGHLPRHVPPVS